MMRAYAYGVTDDHNEGRVPGGLQTERYTIYSLLADESN